MRGKTADIIKSHCGSEICFPNKMAFDKTWIVLIAGCGVLGLAIWGGMNAMTLKMTLLWMFISFGFLTLIMHLFGSPISVLLGNVFKSSADGKRTKARYSDAQMEEKRQRVLQMKQFLQDNKVDIYKQTVLAPREEILREKQEDEFYKFNSTWKGKGQRLGEGGGIKKTEHNFLSQEFLMHEDSSSEDGTDADESITDRTVNDSETSDTNKTAASNQEQSVTESLRQRTNRQRFQLPEEPDLKEKGVITVALRCPDGIVKKRRFTVELQMKVLFAFVESLGYSPSRHVILTTFPRKQLSDVTQTFSEAGLTHDTALVLEEIYNDI